jgi:hypothetical protein
MPARELDERALERRVRELGADREDFGELLEVPFVFEDDAESEDDDGNE